LKMKRINALLLIMISFCISRILEITFEFINGALRSSNFNFENIRDCFRVLGFCLFLWIFTYLIRMWILVTNMLYSNHKKLITSCSIPIYGLAIVFSSSVIFIIVSSLIYWIDPIFFKE